MNAWAKVTDPDNDPVMLALDSDAQRLALISLWCHCSASRQDGAFTRGADPSMQLERGAHWRGVPGELVAALAESGAIEGDRESGWIVVNGGRWGAEVVQDKADRSNPGEADDDSRRRRERDRKRVQRARRRDVSQTCPAPVQSAVPPLSQSLSHGCPTSVPALSQMVRSNDSSVISTGCVNHPSTCPPPVPAIVPACPADVPPSFHIEERARDEEEEEENTINTPPIPPHGGQGLVAGDDQGQDDELEARMLEDLRRSRSSDASTAQVSSPASPAAHPHQPAVPASGAVATAGTPKPGHADLQGLFDQFWAAWPKKVAKAEAEKAFRQAFSSPSAPSLETVLTAISRQNAALRWARENFRYCPNPATWLRGRRWDDVCQQDVSSGTGFRRAVVPSMAQIRSVPLSGDASDCQEQTLSRDHLALIQRGRIIERIQKAIVEGRPVLRSEFQTLQASAIAAACRKAGITPDDIQIVEGA